MISSFIPRMHPSWSSLSSNLNSHLYSRGILFSFVLDPLFLDSLSFFFLGRQHSLIVSREMHVRGKDFEIHSVSKLKIKSCDEFLP